MKRLVTAAFLFLLALPAGAQQVGSYDAAPAPSYEGLWWNAPAGSESGWGVSVSHQGELIFATWFTYDADGRGLWLVMPEGRLVAGGDQSDWSMEMDMDMGMMGRNVGAPTYSGTLYRTSGPPFDSAHFDPGAVGVRAVGMATLIFTDRDNGLFGYTVDEVAQAKKITRQVFADSVPVCTLGGSPGSEPNYQDLWWRAPAGSESGWGVSVAHQGDVLFATWFTYDAEGRGQWLVLPGASRTGASTYSGTLYRTTGPAFDASPWDPSQVRATAVGTGTFDFSDPNNGTFSYAVDGARGAKAITRQVFAGPKSVCR